MNVVCFSSLVQRSDILQLITTQKLSTPLFVPEAMRSRFEESKRPENVDNVSRLCGREGGGCV